MRIRHSIYIYVCITLCISFVYCTYSIFLYFLCLRKLIALRYVYCIPIMSLCASEVFRSRSNIFWVIPYIMCHKFNQLLILTICVNVIIQL